MRRDALRSRRPPSGPTDFEATLPTAFAPQCTSSPIDASAGAANKMLPKQNAADIMVYKPTDHVTVSRSDYAVEVAGHFGGLMLNGRLFEATIMAQMAV